MFVGFHFEPMVSYRLVGLAPSGLSQAPPQLGYCCPPLEAAAPELEVALPFPPEKPHHIGCGLAGKAKEHLTLVLSQNGHMQ